MRFTPLQYIDQIQQAIEQHTRRTGRSPLEIVMTTYVRDVLQAECELAGLLKYSKLNGPYRGLPDQIFGIHIRIDDMPLDATPLQRDLARPR